ncbi:MAG: hypothetical protein ACIAQZ_04025 [Sedimentisphaeraceae bacterium JB056]
MKKLKLIDENWDYLIILDACRYDYFTEIYKSFLPGNVEKRISLGSCTPEWRNNNFPDSYSDIVYISGNPMICKDKSIYDYKAGEHFFEVFEIWKNKWNSQIGTVLPGDLTEQAIRIINQYNDKKIIVHYLQPHAPYICSGVSGCKTANDFQKKGYCNEFGIRRKLFDFLRPYAKKSKLLGNHSEWYLRKWLNIEPLKPIEKAWRELCTTGLRQKYRENLISVMSQLPRLLDHLDGKVLITSDHGELLGEKKDFSHPSTSLNPILREVPYLLIETCKKNTVKPDAFCSSEQTNDNDKIQDKLQQLGYL